MIKKLKEIKSFFKYRKNYISKVKHDVFLAYHVPIKSEYDVTDPIEVDFFLNQLRFKFDYFLDLGANAGYFSALASKYGTFDQIYSFEADKNNYQKLLMTLHSNECDNTVALNLAVDDEMKVRKLYGSGQGASLFSHWGGKELFCNGLVSCVDINSMFAGKFHEKSVLIKLDVEGNEYSCLKGALDCLAEANKVVIFAEHGLNKNFENSNPYFLNLFKLVSDYGYTTYNLQSSSYKLKYSEIQSAVDACKSKNEPFDSLTFIFKKGF